MVQVKEPTQAKGRLKKKAGGLDCSASTQNKLSCDCSLPLNPMLGFQVTPHACGFQVALLRATTQFEMTDCANRAQLKNLHTKEECALNDIFKMEGQNLTLVTEVTLLGFSKDLSTNIMLFAIFFLMLNDLKGNDVKILDLFIASAILPKLLVDLISGQRTISLAACSAQFYIILLTGGFECLLLALMGYDRYVAICRPLHYPILMRWSNCYRITAFVWILSFIIFILPPVGKPARLCYPNTINHFMCEALAITQLACEDINSSQVIIVVTSFLALFLPFLFILVTYICILFSVLNMRSAKRSKAFSTCTSHITVVVLFYGTSVLLYFRPSSKYSTNYGKYFSLLTNVICPTLNPLIYCLNNKDIKEAQRKLFSKFEHSFFLKN
ncbi:olfactory receptor 2K2-like [Dendropsophus ebraccatus]|uniref:olfactory receptor 2K2-like n=1 Tax=Dendropsophus ebraccatus TaxID=150705 RepID=UPI003831C722